MFQEFKLVNGTWDVKNPAGKPEGRTRKANKASDKFIVRRRKTGKKR